MSLPSRKQYTACLAAKCLKTNSVFGIRNDFTVRRNAYVPPARKRVGKSIQTCRLTTAPHPYCCTNSFRPTTRSRRTKFLRRNNDKVSNTRPIIIINYHRLDCAPLSECNRTTWSSGVLSSGGDDEVVP